MLFFNLFVCLYELWDNLNFPSGINKVSIYSIYLSIYLSVCLNGLAPIYLTELLKPYVPTRTLRSSEQLLLAVPKTKLKLRGNRAFSVAAPKLWNELPLHIRQAPTILVFKSRLKTYLYSLAFPSTVRVVFSSDICLCKVVCFK